MIKNNWELKFGLYNGILFGFREYEQKDCTDFVLYIPLINLCLTVYDD